MNLPPYIAYSSEVEQRTVGTRPDVPVRVITCLKTTLTQDMIPAGMDVIVYGDDVTIASPLRLPGNSVTLISRIVTLGPGASLDLSGAAGAPAGTDRAADGAHGASAQLPDATDGSPGDPGNPGADAGSFTLIAGSASGTLAVKARGGDGARGQDGGHGGQGLDGADGARFQVQQTQGAPNVVYSLVSNGQPGVHGGRAGAGGNGGPGGAAGAGGTVTVGLVSGPVPAITCECGGGTAGPGGTAGNTGTAGKAGKGGMLARYTSLGGKGSTFSGYVDSGSYAPDGAPGVVPSAPATPGAPGAPGRPGSPGPVTTQPDLYGAFSPSAQHRLLQLRQAEYFYLSGESAVGGYEDAARLLLWLSLVTTPPPGAAPDPEAARVNARAGALLAQMAQRLDFYGQPANHVPIASLAYYHEILPGELADAAVTEASYNRYVSQAGEQQAQLAALHEMLEQSRSQASALEARRPPLSAQIDTYQTAVSELLLARNQQGVALRTAEEAWEGSIMAQLRRSVEDAKCKTLTDIFGVVGNVVTQDEKALEKTNAAYGFIKGNVESLFKIAGDVAAWDNAVRRVETATGDLPFIAAAAGRLAADGALGDAGKVAVDRAELNLALVPYKSLDPDGKLEAGINVYMAKAEAFSQKQLDYNALQVQRVNLDAQVAQKRAEIERIQNQLAGTANPATAGYKAFAARTYGETLDRLIRDVYGLSQAFRYWALADYSFPPGNGDWTVAYLASVHSDLTQKVTAILNDFGGGEATSIQSFDYRTGSGAAWIIEDPVQLAGFRETGRLDFSLPLDHPWVRTNFAGFAQVVATDFTCEVHGAALPSNQLFVRLAHSGQAPFLDPSGREWRFSHLPVRTSYKYDVQTGQALAGGALGGVDHVQIGLSPFTTWTVRASPADNPGLSLDGVRQIVVRFAGRYRETSSLRAARALR